MRKNEGANWGVYHLLLLLLVCKRSTPYLSSNHIRCDKKQWSLKMNRGAGSVLRIMERILGVGKGRERIMNFQQIAEKHMKKSLWRLLSVSLCLFHSLIFSPPSLFFKIYISWSSTFVDFTILYVYISYILICPLCQSLILQTETLSLQCSIIYLSLFIKFFFFSVCVKCHIVRLLSFLLASLALIERLSRTTREIAHFVLSLSWYYET